MAENEKTIKLGKMEPDYNYGCPAVSSEESKDKVERFPDTYIRRDNLPVMTPGQKVTMTGVVTSFEDRKVRKMEDGKEEIEVERCAQIDILELKPMEKIEPQDPPKPDDMGDIEKGLDEASDNDEEEE